MLEVWIPGCARNEPSGHPSPTRNESLHSRQCQKVALLHWKGGWGGGWGWSVLSPAPIDEMKQVNFSFGLRRNEKQMSRRVTESVCVLSARPAWVMALIWPMCSATVYYPKVAGWRWERGADWEPLRDPSLWRSPSPLICNTDKCGTCLQMPAHPNWAAGTENDSFALSIGPGEFKGRVEKKKGPHHLCTTRRAYKHTCRIHNIVVRNKREIMETLVNTAHDEACG